MSANQAQASEINAYYRSGIKQGRDFTREDAGREWITLYAKKWRETYTLLGYIPSRWHYAGVRAWVHHEN